MALVFPMLVALLFGSAELGYYFYNEHVVVDAVRDGARYAARLPTDDVGCDGLDPDAESSIQAATRLVSPNAADTAANRRIPHWEGNDTVTVTVTCVDNDGYAGLYSNQDELPRVRVEADLAYPALFSALGINLTLNLKAASEAAVVGS